MTPTSRPLEITVPIYGGDAVSCLRWSDDGEELAVGLLDGEGEPAARPRHLLRHADVVTCLAPAPRSALLAVGDLGGEVRMWDVADGCPVAAVVRLI